jgi:hypothetical protein
VATSASTVDFDVTPTTPYDELPEFLTAEQAAARMQVSTWSIRDKVKQGVIPKDPRFHRIRIPKEQFKA